MHEFLAVGPSGKKRSAYVYALVHATEPRFKIGHSVNPIARAQLLRSGYSKEFKEPLDLMRSCMWQCPTARHARGLEGTLHLRFLKYNLEIARGSGYTEWFSLDALPDVREYVRLNRDDLGCSDSQPVNKPASKPRKEHLLGMTPADFSEHLKLGLGIFTGIDLTERPDIRIEYNPGATEDISDPKERRTVWRRIMTEFPLTGSY